jgi:hypothetical protein
MIKIILIFPSIGMTMLMTGKIMLRDNLSTKNNKIPTHIPNTVE